MSATTSDTTALNRLADELQKLLAVVRTAIGDDLGEPAPLNGKQDILLPADVARALKVSPKKVYGWIETKRLKAANVNPSGKRPRYSIERSDFETFRKSLQPTPVASRKPRKPHTSTKRY
jgi:hypothetical protein